MKVCVATLLAAKDARLEFRLSTRLHDPPPKKRTDERFYKYI
jgi:hypothetical protein